MVVDGGRGALLARLAVSPFSLAVFFFLLWRAVVAAAAVASGRGKRPRLRLRLRLRLRVGGRRRGSVCGGSVG